MYQKKVWLTGSNGRLGQTIQRFLNPYEIEILATDKDQVDITNSFATNQFVDRNRPEIIINCSSVSNRKFCEENPIEAFRVNGIGARNVAIASNRGRAKLVQLSTEEVFDGKSFESYKEYDKVNPVTVYGKSKEMGEEFVKSFARKYFIIRTSRMYSLENKFVESIIEEAKNTGKVVVPKNQFTNPTSAIELAKFILRLIETSEYGLYHASCKGVCSRKEFAQKVLELSQIKADVVEVEDKENIEFRQVHLALKNFILDITGVYEFSTWQSALEEYINKIIKK
ncbi:MAG: NAD(P)-dependent oxidoreductase [Peptoniphilaceae bacterium]|nr:NAD(P)-dependent oxidoreductase [Peptoniphilaceae bacterium]MDD7383552.1 NAD(P)-dependent oxidoreductase [Peptoniphilaceae bacterium]MDY3738725.1 NAD(P)-dependent oxidoreductase [Peptoniphilaceae bacterium]